MNTGSPEYSDAFTAYLIAKSTPDGNHFAAMTLKVAGPRYFNCDVCDRRHGYRSAVAGDHLRVMATKRMTASDDGRGYYIPDSFRDRLVERLKAAG